MYIDPRSTLYVRGELHLRLLRPADAGNLLELEKRLEKQLEAALADVADVVQLEIDDAEEVVLAPGRDPDDEDEDGAVLERWRHVLRPTRIRVPE